MRKHRFLRFLLILILLAALTWGALICMVWWKETHIPQLDHYDAIVVLGAQVKADGEMSVQLQLRMDAAYAAWQRQPCLIVCCGGQGANEPAPEGAVMRDYLISLGVPEDMVIADTVSATTRENLRQARQLLEERGMDATICIVTSDYHLPRALALAADEGLTATGIGSEIKQEYWLKNHGREALAWVKYWAQKYLGL